MSCDRYWEQFTRDVIGGDSELLTCDYYKKVNIEEDNALQQARLNANNAARNHMRSISRLWSLFFFLKSTLICQTKGFWSKHGDYGNWRWTSTYGHQSRLVYWRGNFLHVVTAVHIPYNVVMLRCLYIEYCFIWSSWFICTVVSCCGVCYATRAS